MQVSAKNDKACGTSTPCSKQSRQPARTCPCRQKPAVALRELLCYGSGHDAREGGEDGPHAERTHARHNPALQLCTRHENPVQPSQPPKTAPTTTLCPGHPPWAGMDLVEEKHASGPTIPGFPGILVYWKRMCAAPQVDPCENSCLPSYTRSPCLLHQERPPSWCLGFGRTGGHFATSGPSPEHPWHCQLQGEQAPQQGVGTAPHPTCLAVDEALWKWSSVGVDVAHALPGQEGRPVPRQVPNLQNAWRLSHGALAMA
jgi:hypothetical protein